MDRNNSTKWDESDLLAIIKNGVEEAVDFEYKACAALTKRDQSKTEISKDVSSFANSAGGIIVYGIIEKDHKPECLDQGFDPAELTKEWLEQKIQGNIRPRIENVHINPVDLVNTHPGKVVYVITIPPGTTAHQASDKKYYKRFNFQSVAMEDYEIRDTMNRLKHPKIKAIFSFELLNVAPTPQYKMNILISNWGTIRVRDFKLVFYWPERVKPKVGKGFTKRIVPPKQIIPPPPSQLIECTVQRSDTVIFPDDEWRLTDDDLYNFTYHVGDHEIEFFLDNDFKLTWKVFADDMPVQEGQERLFDLRAF